MSLSRAGDIVCPMCGAWLWAALPHGAMGVEGAEGGRGQPDRQAQVGGLIRERQTQYAAAATDEEEEVEEEEEEEEEEWREGDDGRSGEVMGQVGRSGLSYLAGLQGQ